jgi:hypothetical protein
MAIPTTPRPERPASRLQQLWGWLIGEPIAPQLRGQYCDRLRPAFLQRALAQALPLHTSDDVLLVDWRWDSLRSHVSGLVVHNSQVHPFRWWPQLDRFELRRATVRLEAITWPRQKTCRASGRQRQPMTAGPWLIHST